MTQQQLDIVKKDRMKYKGNSLSANLAILAIVFNAFYFVVVYKINHNDMYDMLLGASVVCNLLFMLAAFFCSTKVKAYSQRFSIVMLVLAAIQIVRIFILPASKLKIAAIEPSQHTWMVVWLLCSTLSLVLGGFFGILKAKARSNYINEVESGQLDISFISKQEG